ncbi:MAG: aminotransferase class III-fold pyridoxal phosphate-dependent enzyme [Clostridia bacterium]|nr:aminotransferase class III-fold pyridoxal phosphate-dependent enzyme [Clostridia bacterium]MDR3644938.1 aminotransferase class III-fold pyridoxal phosphate-dependent enzyme [Clostridia bacterium]
MDVNTYTKSRELFERALKVVPAGVYGHQGPAEACFIPADAYPYFSTHAKGSHVWDVDGNEFIDFMCAYGPISLGYCDDEVDGAAIEQIKKLNCATTPSGIMVDLAELMVETVDMADWSFFAKNGNDATNYAVMVAKAATGRDKIILINGNYHGVSPWTQLYGYPGISQADVSNNIYVDWNNFEQLEKVVSEHRGEIAGFISTPYYHPVFQDNVLPAEGYWQKVRKLCTDNGIVLIVDDVRCGFRLDMKGSDHYFGFKADLSCFCKAIANGWNISAICGVDSLKDAAASVMFTGSYWLAAVPMAAAIACVSKMQRINAPVVMQGIGKKLTDGLVKAGAQHGFDLRVSGVPSMWYMRIANDDSLILHQEWVAECVRRGIFFANHHNQFVNCAISDEDINKALEVADEAFRIVKAAHPEIGR